MRIAIIGAGPGGLSAAYMLTKENVQVDIYESRQQVGGLSASLNLWGQNIELGPHFLLQHSAPEVQMVIKELLDDSEIHHYKRLTRIYQKNALIHYPPSPITIVKNLGIKNAILTLIALCNPFLKAAYKHERKSFETYIKKSLGIYIYRTFFQEYTEKLWDIPCNQINEDYAKSLIGLGSLDFLKLIKRFFIDSSEKNNTDCIYPKEGMSALWEAMKKKIEEQGGFFYFSSDIKNLTADGSVSLELSTGDYKQYDYIISTIPEAKLLNLLKDPLSEKLLELSKGLKFRNVIFIFIQIENGNFLTDNNIYVYSKAIKCIRITNYNRFRNRKGNDIIMLEYWMNENDSIWNAANEELLNIANRDLFEIFRGEKIKIRNSKVIRLKNAFPVPDLNITKIKSDIHSHLKGYEKIIRIGRSNQAKFNYGMEDAIKDGIVCAKNILKHL